MPPRLSTNPRSTRSVPLVAPSPSATLISSRRSVKPPSRPRRRPPQRSAPSKKPLSRPSKSRPPPLPQQPRWPLSARSRTRRTPRCKTHRLTLPLLLPHSKDSRGVYRGFLHATIRNELNNPSKTKHTRLCLLRYPSLVLLCFAFDDNDWGVEWGFSILSFSVALLQYENK